MARINANPVLLRQVARELDSIASDMIEQNSKLGQSKSQTEAAWKSNYTPVFSDSVRSTQTKIGKSCEAIKEAAKLLRQIADQVERAEREIARMTSGGGSW